MLMTDSPTRRLTVAGVFLAVLGTLWLVPVHAQARSAGSSPLMSWLTGDLEPSLTQRFAEHPRFRGQSLQVLPMRETQWRVRSDALSGAIVRHLSEALADQSGTRVVPAGRASREACMAASQVEYRIGVDVRAAGDDRVQVDVRVFDVNEGSWVGGIGGSWSGPLVASERQDLRREVVAETARGARELPFDQRQADLMAKSLAAQIDCELATARQRAPRGAGLYLQPAGELDVELQKAGLLLLHALSGEHGWHQVTDPEAADLSLALHTQRLDRGLSLFWVTLQRPSSERADEAPRVVATASTYVEDQGLQSRTARVRRASPVPVADVPSSAPATLVRAVPAEALSAAPMPVEVSAAYPEPLLSTPRLRPQASARDCTVAVSAPTDAGAMHPACALVEVNVGGAATVFWFWQPADCRLGGSRRSEAQARLARRETRGPSTMAARLSLASGATFDSLYIIAVEAGEDTSALEEVLQRHPGGVDCDAPDWERGLRRWALTLESTMLRFGRAADWQAVREPRRPTRVAQRESD